MVPLIDIIFLVIALILLIAVGAYDIKAAEGISALSTQDVALGSAHKYAAGAAVAAILGAALVIGLIVAYFIFASETIGETMGTVATVMLIITLILILLAGILSAVVAARMNSSTAGDATVRKAAYTDAIIATLIGIIGFALIAGILIAIRVHQHKAKQAGLGTVTGKGGPAQLNEMNMQQMMKLATMVE